jgi:hypothetical protein
MFNISLLAYIAWSIRLSLLVVVTVTQLNYTEPLQLFPLSNAILLRAAASNTLVINTTPASNVVIEALSKFKELHGTLRIPASFKVPNNSLLWPEHTWGLHLGNNAYTNALYTIFEITKLSLCSKFFFQREAGSRHACW